MRFLFILIELWTYESLRIPLLFYRLDAYGKLYSFLSGCCPLRSKAAEPHVPLDLLVGLDQFRLKICELASLGDMFFSYLGEEAATTATTPATAEAV